MLCSGSFGSWADPCTRSYFQSLPPLALVVIVSCSYIPLTQILYRIIKPVFTPWLPLSEAEALLETDSAGESVQLVSKPKPPLWRTICLSSLALVEAICWSIIASYRIVLSTGGPDYLVISPFLSFLSWLPAVVIPVLRPTLTPPYDLFTFYLLQLTTGIFRLGVIWYDRGTLGTRVNVWDVAGATANSVILLALLFIVLRMPLNLPRNKTIEEKIVCILFPQHKWL